MVAGEFALRGLCVCLCVCVWERQASPRGLGQQSQAAHAETSSRGFKQAPACNMDETGAPCRTVRGPKACSDLTVSLSVRL